MKNEVVAESREVPVASCQVRVVEAFVANNDRGGRGGGGGQRHDSTVRPPRSWATGGQG
jgi:hypothetical protein